MKIALMGANNTGKTTLTIELHKIVGNTHGLIAYSRPTAAARRLGYQSARDVPEDVDKQFEFQYECLLEQIRAQKQMGKNYIADRSTLDPLAFLNAKLPFLNLTIQHQMYEKLAFEFCEYDFLFFVPAFGGKMEDNGVRLLTPQEPVEAEFKRLRAKIKKPVYTLKTTSLTNRIQEVCQILRI